MATAQVIAVDEAGAEQAGIVLGPRRPVAADRRVLLEIDHDAEAISTLKVAGPIAIFFLFAYGVAEVLRVDLAERFPSLLEGLDACHLRHHHWFVHQNRFAGPSPRTGLYRDHPVPI